MPIILQCLIYMMRIMIWGHLQLQVTIETFLYMQVNNYQCAIINILVITNF